MQESEHVHWYSYSQKRIWKVTNKEAMKIDAFVFAFPLIVAKDFQCKVWDVMLQDKEDLSKANKTSRQAAAKCQGYAGI